MTTPLEALKAAIEALEPFKNLANCYDNALDHDSFPVGPIALKFCRDARTAHALLSKCLEDGGASEDIEKRAIEVIRENGPFVPNMVRALASHGLLASPQSPAQVPSVEENKRRETLQEQATAEAKKDALWQLLMQGQATADDQFFAAKWINELLTRPGEREAALEEAAKDRLTESDLYYLKSILRQLQEYKSLINTSEIFQPSIGTEVLADNCNWLDCFIENKERTLASTPPKPAAEDAVQYPGANPDCVWCDGGKRLPKKLYETKLKTPGGAPIYVCAGCQAPAA